MGNEKKPNNNVLIEYTAWIFKWIFKIFLFLVVLALLAAGGYALKNQYDKHQKLKAESQKEKARACLAKEIPIIEQGIKSFRDSINANSSLKDVVDVAFYEDTVISRKGSLAGFRVNKLLNDQDTPEKDKKGLKSFYAKLEASRHEDYILVSDNDIKLKALVLELKTECESDFNFLINITDKEDRSLDKFNVWANNTPKGYEEGWSKNLHRDFSTEREQKIRNEKERKAKIIREKKRKEKERVDAPKRIKREHEALQERKRQERLSDPTRFCKNQKASFWMNEKSYCHHKDTGKIMLINFEKNRLEPTIFVEKTIPYTPKEKGGYVPDKGPVHQF